MTLEELALRHELGIRDDAKYVIVLDQTCHMDWDWLQTFEQYYSADRNLDFPGYSVRKILGQAGQYLTSGSAYRYSLAEIGYLQRFAADPGQNFTALAAAGARFRLVGGGITSPDNLLPHGETLLRNFLVARAWAAAALPDEQFRQVWIPDDFGHDAQFPILVEALGMQAAGFSRIPGDLQQFWAGGPYTGPGGIAAQVLWTEGVDFVWQAADGSSCLAHWMQAGYFQGQSISTTNLDALTQCFTTNQQSPLAGGYTYIPVCNDFSLPVPNLPDAAAQWNAQYGATYEAQAIALSFDDFVQLIAFHTGEMKTRTLDSTDAPFLPVPYWMGFYASQPEIKILHQEATNLLLAAETFGAIGDRLIEADTAHAEALSAGWNALVPSTHHDFLPGTSSEPVYRNEQLRLLHESVSIGESALDAARLKIAASIGVEPPAGQRAVAVFNPLGFARGGLVTMAPLADFTAHSFGDDGGTIGPVQTAADGSWIFVIPDAKAVPSLGYATFYLSATAAGPAAGADTANGATLNNGIVFATIGNDGTITGFGSAQTGEQVLDGPANALQFFSDAGNQYQFGSEKKNALQNRGAVLSNATLEVVENGPVRGMIVVRGTYIAAGMSVPAVHEYAVVAGEPLLRIRTRGAAPAQTSVMADFPLGETVAALDHGTPYHWQRMPPLPLYNTQFSMPPIFHATHSFVIPANSSGTPLAAIYHQHVAAWSVGSGNRSLTACLLRNLPTHGYGPGHEPVILSVDSDPDPHTLSYALRIPDGLGAPESGTPLRESLAYRIPLAAQAADRATGYPRRLPPRYSLASIAPGSAILTAAKSGSLAGTAGALVLRIYQPTNATLDVTITLGSSRPTAARPVTAMETELAPARAAALDVQLDGDTITLHALRALTTVAVTW